MTNPARVFESPGIAPDSSAEAAAPAAGEADSRHHRTGDDLVLPGGSIIPSALAAAITATAAMVWIQRRRRYRPGTIDDPRELDDLQELPAPVRAAQRHTRHVTTPAQAEPVRSHRLPCGGVGLIGSGAEAAARGLIITALTAGTPTDPAQRATVIIDRPSITAIIGDIPSPTGRDYTSPTPSNRPSP